MAKKIDWLSTTPAVVTPPTYDVPRIDRNKICVGFDTETTGLYSVKHNPITGLRYKDPDNRYCYPYLVCFVYYKPRVGSKGEAKGSFGATTSTRVEHYYEFPVDYTTRQPLAFDANAYKNLDEIYQFLTNQDVLLIGHNVKFDLRMVHSLFTRVPSKIRESRYPRMSETLIRDILLFRADDTTLMYHALDSSQRLELKPLATNYAGIVDDDEVALKVAVDNVRKMITSGNLDMVKIANLKSIPYLTKAPRRGWYILDTWLGTTDRETKSKGESMGDPPPLSQFIRPDLLAEIRELSIAYCMMDSWRTLSLHKLALEMFESPPSNHPDLLQQYDINRTSLYSTYALDTVGVSIHPEYLSDHTTTLRDEVIRITKRIHRLASPYYKPKPQSSRYPWIKDRSKTKFNPNSDKQLADLIHTHMGVEARNFTDSGNPSMKIDNMIDLLTLTTLPPEAREVLSLVIALKKYDKALGTELGYVQKAIGSNTSYRLYANYNPTGTGTLRLSSSDPNGQNIGKGQVSKSIAELVTESVSLRPIFGPSAGREWYSVDYVQIQLVIFAILTKDPEMNRAVMEQRDIHDFMARKIFNTPPDASPSDGERRIAKAVNFGYIFGSGERKVEATAKMSGLFTLLRMLFPSASSAIAHNKRTAERDGYVRTAGGYPLKVPYQKPHAATNYIIQGTEGEIVKYALYCCTRYLSEHVPNSFLSITVHDELVFDFPVGEGIHHMPTLIQYMVLGGSRMNPPIPLRVDAKYIAPLKGWNEGTPVEI